MYEQFIIDTSTCHRFELSVNYCTCSAHWNVEDIKFY